MLHQYTIIEFIDIFGIRLKQLTAGTEVEFLLVRSFVVVFFFFFPSLHNTYIPM